MREAAGVKRGSGAGKRGEQGSALLIVFVFAAMIAIMLYMELPVAVFEAQRQKEQLLIDRGNEYARAVKLFVRKLGSYPPSIEALEKTNQIRFLRHRFKDPFTGKEDWRMLHAGPNGMLTDSKVKPVGNWQNGNGQNGNGGNPAAAQTGAAGSGGFGSASNGAGSASGSTFGSFGSGGTSSDSTAPSVVVPTIPQRGPAIAANGGGQVAGSAGDQNPMAPLMAPGQTGASGVGQPAAPGQNGVPTGTNPTGTNSTGTNSATANGSTSPQGTGLTPGTSTTGTGTGLGVITSPGIAGVASRAAGHTIKTVNDQTDYSLWEFYYDPAKDASRGIANALGAAGTAQQGQGNPQQNGLGQTPFGPNQQQNGFGQSQPNGFGTGSSFGTGNSSAPSSPFGNGSGTPGTNVPGTSVGVTPGAPPPPNPQ